MKRLSCHKSLPVSLLAASLTAVLSGTPVWAANHREAPLTALDAKADITDWFAFVSYDDPSKVTFILNVDAAQEPADGPNYYPFDPEIVYEMKIDNTFDAVEDITFQFRFKTEIRLPQIFTGFVGIGNGVAAPQNSPNPELVPPGTPIIPPAITALDGPGSEGFSLRQNYTVKMIKGTGKQQRVEDLTPSKPLFAVPTNVGPRTMPDYAKLAKQGIYQLSGGIKVFAGTIDDPFYVDLGSPMDSLNFRSKAYAAGLPPGVYSDAQDGADAKNFAADRNAGFNVNSIALEVPITMLTQDGKLHNANEALAVIGAYATTSRPRIKIYDPSSETKAIVSNETVQIQRMGNPLINELLIGTGDKDDFSMAKPTGDIEYVNYFADPMLARVINAAYAGALSVPAAPRLDLIPMVFYGAPVCPGCTAAQSGPLADLLRLNTGVAPTPSAQRKRLGLIAGDTAGFPNGRRVSDDVTDISARVVAGVLNSTFNSFPNNRIADGVNTNDVPYQETFPYVAFANSGRNSRHIDIGEPGCASVEPPFNDTLCPSD